MDQPTKTDRFGERLRIRSASLTPSLRAVVEYINENRRAVLNQSALEIAAETGTSDASVIRAIQALGFEGLRDLKHRLRGLQEGFLSSPERMARTIEGLNSSVTSTISFVLEGHIHSVEALGNEQNRQAIGEAVNLLRNARKIGLFGINASGILADYAARHFVRNGHKAYAMNRTGMSLSEQLLEMEEGDVLIMMIQRNAHREGSTVLREAQRLGVPLILLTSTDESPFVKDASAVIMIPRGWAGKVPLHSPVLVCLEVIALALAATEPEKSSLSLERMHAFQGDIRSGPRGT